MAFSPHFLHFHRIARRFIDGVALENLIRGVRLFILGCKII
jgi:hypothetical protein